MLDKVLKVLIYSTIFLVPIFFLPFTFEFLEFNKLYLLFFLVWLSVLIWFLKMIIEDKEVRFRYSTVDYFVLAFLAIAVVSSIFSIDKLSSILGHHGRFSTGLVSLLTFGAFYFLIANNLGKTKPKSPKPQAKGQNLEESGEGIVTVSGIIKTLLWSSAVVMFFAYFSLFGIWLKLSNIGGLAPLINKIALWMSPVSSTIEGTAMFLTIMLILAVIMALNPSAFFNNASKGLRAGGAKKKKRGFLRNLLLGIFIFSAFLLLIIADFTPAWIVLSLSLLALVVLALRRRILKKEVHRLILPIALIIVSALFLFLNFRALMASFPNFTFNSSPGFLVERSLTQQESWGTAIGAATSNFKNALIGSGPGTFFYDFSKFKPSNLSLGPLWSIRFDRSGSAVSEILATMGFLGLLSFLLLFGSLFWLVFDMGRYLKNRFARKKNGGKINIDTALLLIVFSATVLIQFLYYQITALRLLFWLFLGLVVGWQGIEEGREEREWVKEKKFKLKDYLEMALVLETASIVLFLAFVVACFFGFKLYLADMKYVQALRQPELDEKIQLLQEAIRLNSKQVRYQMTLSKAFSVKAQQALASTKPEEDQSKAIQNIQAARWLAVRATSVSPNQADTWQNLAGLYQDIAGIAKDKEQFVNLAIETLNKAAALDPKNPSIYTNIGNLYLLSDKQEEARAEFEKAISWKPNYAPAQIALALMLEKDGKRDEAINKLELLLAKTPNNAEVLFQLGRLYYNNEEVEKAVTQFKTALILSPQYSNARFSLGLAYEKQGKIDEALAEFEKVLKANPDNKELKERIQRLKQGAVQPEEETGELPVEEEIK